MELADGGTVFLDEIGDISQELQTKLLRFLQEREFERVGGTRPIRVEVRVIAATNRDLGQAVKESRFREDLFHRLNVIAIHLAPLKKRKEDIPVLAHYFLQRFSREAKKGFSEIAAEAEKKFLAYDWPGNVRELANVIERAVVLGQGPEIDLKDLPPRIVAPESTTPSQSLSYREAIGSFKREVILRALAQAEGNHAAAAKILGLHEKYLFRLIKSLQMERR
jgi:transcriptional regulator with PAS, ATPase and Fis domain